LPPPDSPALTPAGASLDRPYRDNAHNSAPPETLPYPCGLWFFRNPTTGEVRPFRCASWRCPACTPLLVRRWTALIREAPVQRHIVLTALGPDPVTARSRLAHIIQGIRRGELGPKPRTPWVHEHFAAIEGTPAAGYHAHLLQWGHYLPQPRLSALAGRYRAGTVVWCRSITADNIPQRVRTYVVRHLVGTLHPTQHKPGRRVRYTRGFWPGQTVAQIADRLWPPDHQPWELIKPDLEQRAISQAQWWEGKQALHDDFLIRTLSEDQLLRRRIIFPAADD